MSYKIHLLINFMSFAFISVMRSMTKKSQQYHLRMDDCTCAYITEFYLHHCIWMYTHAKYNTNQWNKLQKVAITFAEWLKKWLNRGKKMRCAHQQNHSWKRKIKNKAQPHTKYTNGNRSETTIRVTEMQHIQMTIIVLQHKGEQQQRHHHSYMVAMKMIHKEKLLNAKNTLHKAETFSLKINIKRIWCNTKQASFVIHNGCFLFVCFRFHRRYPFSVLSLRMLRYHFYFMWMKCICCSLLLVIHILHIFSISNTKTFMPFRFAWFCYTIFVSLNYCCYYCHRNICCFRLCRSMVCVVSRDWHHKFGILRKMLHLLFVCAILFLLKQNRILLLLLLLFFFISFAKCRARPK